MTGRFVPSEERMTLPEWATGRADPVACLSGMVADVSDEVDVAGSRHGGTGHGSRRRPLAGCSCAMDAVAARPPGGPLPVADPLRRLTPSTTLSPDFATYTRSTPCADDGRDHIVG